MFVGKPILLNIFVLIKMQKKDFYFFRIFFGRKHNIVRVEAKKINVAIP